MKYFDNYMGNPLVQENRFIGMSPQVESLPRFEESKNKLPQPFLDGRGDLISFYWKAWELAFDHLDTPTAENGFVANFIDTAFNDAIFMWDSAFILMFGKYGRRVFDFQRTLDNFYAKQHPDGFICREIRENDGGDAFHRHDPSSTGPNIFPWTEYDYFLHTRDTERLKKVFPVLLAFHRWMRQYRTWPDGSYWSSGWGCGMDNQPRMPLEFAQDFYHGHLSWVDTTAQQILAAKQLTAMAEVLGRTEEIDDLRRDSEHLGRYMNERMWDEENGFYYDLRPDGSRSDIKTIGAYWNLLAGVVPPERLGKFVHHLTDPEEFNTTYRIPALPKSSPYYEADAIYWNGGVWTPTNYMIIRALSGLGYESLAHEIAVNHVEHAAEVYHQTGTIWEYLQPEAAKPGKIARRDFAGWGALPAISVFFEYILGIRADVPNRKITWHVLQTAEHGIREYPFGTDGVVDLKCKARHNPAERPEIEIRSAVPLTVELIWDGGKETVSVPDY